MPQIPPSTIYGGKTYGEKVTMFKTVTNLFIKILGMPSNKSWWKKSYKRRGFPSSLKFIFWINIISIKGGGLDGLFPSILIWGHPLPKMLAVLVDLKYKSYSRFAFWFIVWFIVHTWTTSKPNCSYEPWLINLWAMVHSMNHGSHEQWLIWTTFASCISYWFMETMNHGSNMWTMVHRT